MYLSCYSTTSIVVPMVSFIIDQSSVFLSASSRFLSLASPFGSVAFSVVVKISESSSSDFRILLLPFTSLLVVLSYFRDETISMAPPSVRSCVVDTLLFRSLIFFELPPWSPRKRYVPDTGGGSTFVSCPPEMVVMEHEGIRNDARGEKHGGRRS